MNRLQTVARNARRRLFARDLVSYAGTYLTCGALAGLALLACERVVGVNIRWQLLFGTPIALSGLVAVIHTARRRHTSLAAALDVDTSLGLHDRLSTGVWIAGPTQGKSIDRDAAYAKHPSPADDPFAAIALHDAENAAGGVRLRDAIPIKLNGTWGVWPAITAAGIAAGLWLPHMGLAAREQEERLTRILDQAKRDDAAAEIASDVVSRSRISPTRMMSGS